VFGDKGSFVARVSAGSGVENRSIDLGESDGQFVEVLGGLRENERVLLTDPPGAATPQAPKPATPGDAIAVQSNAVRRP
jgi:hypothetical protein